MRHRGHDADTMYGTERSNPNNVMMLSQRLPGFHDLCNIVVIPATRHIALLFSREIGDVTTLVMPTHCSTQRTQPLQPVSPWISLSAILVLAGPSIDSEAVGWQQECQSAVGQLDRATIALTFFLDQLRPPINLREKCVSYISQQSRTPLGPISALGNLGLLGS